MGAINAFDLIYTPAYSPAFAEEKSTLSKKTNSKRKGKVKMYLFTAEIMESAEMALKV